MSGPSDNLNDLEGDITNLKTLMGVIFTEAVESDTDAKVQQLLWIARDLTERLSETVAACHHKVMNESKVA